MKKALALIVIAVVALSAFAFYRGYLRLPGQSPIASQLGPGSAAQNGDPKSPVLGNQQPVTTTPGNTPSGGTSGGTGSTGSGSTGSGSAGSGKPTEPARQVFSILGRSNNLTAKQWSAMLGWRKYATAFAGSHPGVYVNGWPKSKEVCLTFDDGPDGQTTPRILDILEQYNVKASFFFIGKQLGDNQDVVKRAFNDGDLVLSHTWDHKQLIKLTPDQIRNELKQTEDKLYDAVGVRPAIVRPPYGDIDDPTAKVLRDSGDAAVLWSIDTLDWSQKDKANIVKNVMDNVRSGDIILMHSTPEQSVDVDALPEIITQLQKQGYHFVTLSEMLGIPAYK